MQTEDTTPEIKEKLEQVVEHGGSWNKLLAITTALIAVFAALASLVGGGYANEAMLQKNNAILYQNQASDQWTYYQAKSIKLNMAQNFYEQTHNDQLRRDAVRYNSEQQVIRKQAEDYERQVREANNESTRLLAKHERMALAITLSQIAIALSAISALLRRRSLWIASLLVAFVGVIVFVVALA
jgi:Domain of unknown function (DUF4337)